MSAPPVLSLPSSTDSDHVEMSSSTTNIRNESEGGRKRQRSWKERIRSMFHKRKSDSLLWSDPRWRICQPAQEDAGKAASVPSEEAEAAYISQEFLNLSGQSSTVICVPTHFLLSPERRRDELAEEQVFNWIKELGEIEGMRKIVFFIVSDIKVIKIRKIKNWDKKLHGKLISAFLLITGKENFNSCMRSNHMTIKLKTKHYTTQERKK